MRRRRGRVAGPWVALALAMLSAGCVRELAPLATPRVEIVPSRQSFRRGTRVHLINDRVGAPHRTVLREGVHRFVVAPEVWTKDFLLSLRRELGSRGVLLHESGVPLGVAVDVEPREEVEPHEEGAHGVPILRVTLRAGGYRGVYPAGERGETFKDALHAAMTELLEDEALHDAVAPTAGGAIGRGPDAGLAPSER